MAHFIAEANTNELPWPEPLVIEMIAERLEQQRIEQAAVRTLARHHAVALREMLDGASPWQPRRSALARTYAQLGISNSAVMAIDADVFLELTRLAETRFRCSPRRQKAAADQLRNAMLRLPSWATPAAAPAPLRPQRLRSPDPINA